MAPIPINMSGRAAPSRSIGRKIRGEGASNLIIKRPIKRNDHGIFK